MVDRSLYRVGVVLSVDSLGEKGQKALKVCKIDVGSGSSGSFAEEEPLTIVTSATNVREGSRIAVAPVGSIVETETGEELKIKKTSVGGVMSEGMLCDSRMLGWSGGAAGIATQIPDSVEIGSPPPAVKPRLDQASTEGNDSSPPIEGLFEKKLSKEEKKKLAEAKRLAKRAAKEVKKGEDNP